MQQQHPPQQHQMMMPPEWPQQQAINYPHWPVPPLQQPPIRHRPQLQQQQQQQNQSSHNHQRGERKQQQHPISGVQDQQNYRLGTPHFSAGSNSSSAASGGGGGGVGPNGQQLQTSHAEENEEGDGIKLIDALEELIFECKVQEEKAQKMGKMLSEILAVFLQSIANETGEPSTAPSSVLLSPQAATSSSSTSSNSRTMTARTPRLATS
jgi:hypothetical protein